MKVRLCVAVLALTAACSHADPPTVATGPTASFAGDTPTPPCVTLFRASQTTPRPNVAGGASVACTAPSGGIVIVTGFHCHDNTVLWSTSREAGIRGWGVQGQPFHPSPEPAADAGYKAAFEAC